MMTIVLHSLVRWLPAAAALLLLTAKSTLGDQSPPAEPPLPIIAEASWIWGDMGSDVAEFRLDFTLDGPPTAARVLITADNGYELYINGHLVGYDIGPDRNVWSSIERWDITDHLTDGTNILGIRGICLGGQRGVIAAVRIDRQDAEPREWLTGADWQVTSQADPEEYTKPEYVAGDEWKPAHVLGPMGMQPWGDPGLRRLHWRPTSGRPAHHAGPQPPGRRFRLARRRGLPGR